jgi:hypothetical protein
LCFSLATFTALSTALEISLIEILGGRLLILPSRATLHSVHPCNRLANRLLCNRTVGLITKYNPTNWLLSLRDFRGFVDCYPFG